ncbi:hypothetical protein, partial [Nocardia cyriacigeorgica]|uniref:hypothetical protein n=1 Tax=Nocardia cyriacigeorgica TaxID=135487 RepID=UPI001C4982E6
MTDQRLVGEPTNGSAHTGGTADHRAQLCRQGIVAAWPVSGVGRPEIGGERSRGVVPHATG